MLKYYTLEKTRECRDLYFNNEGIFNFWNEYLMIHIGDCNVVFVNKPGTEFHGVMSQIEETMVKNRVKYDFCCLKECVLGSETSCCEIARDWGEEVCDRLLAWVNKT